MSLDFQKILCPVDLSGFSLEALKLAAKVAENSNATLYLLHVVDNPYDELYMGSITQADPALLELYKSEPHKRAQVLDATKTHSEVLLKQFCQDAVDRVRRVKHQVETGNPFEVILDVAESNGVDLIVLATHGRTGIKRLLIGNVAEKVVRHAPCPVLTVKSKVSGAAAKGDKPNG
jgi:nucleotide-binding universal stress UspA family protein